MKKPPEVAESILPETPPIGPEIPTWEDVEQIVLEEIEAARQYQAQISQDRTRLWDRYAGKPLGNEEAGKSRYISRDILDKIEWVIPHLLTTFATGDPKIKISIEGQPDWVGEAVMKRIQDDLSDSSPPLYALFYDVFKDALVSGTSHIKVSWDRDFTREILSFDLLSQQDLVRLSQDPTFTLLDEPQVVADVGGIYYRNVRGTILRQISDQVYAEGLPPWEVLWAEGARYVDDEYPKGHRTKVTIDYLYRIQALHSTPDEPYFYGLERLERDGSSTSDRYDVEPYAEAEKRHFYGDKSLFDSPVTRTGTKGKQIVDLVEWYTSIDLDGDGYLDPVTAWVADGKLIRVERNPEGMIPLCKFTAMRDPYHYEGRSYAEILEDVQNLKTMLVRRTLDNLAYQNAGRWLVDPSGSVDLEALIRNSPGDIVYGRPGSVTPLTPAPVSIRELMRCLEYLDTVAENRTGMTRYNQGMEADTLNKTATGVVRIQEAGMVRIHSMASCLAEEGLRSLYRALARLYQVHREVPFSVEIRGRKVVVTPQQIQGKIRCRVDLGLTAILEETEVARLDRALGMLTNLAQRWPDLLQPEQVYNYAARYLYCLGFTDVTSVIPTMETFMSKSQASQQNAQMTAMMQQQAAAAKAEQERVDSLRQFFIGLLKEADKVPEAAAIARLIDPASVIGPQGQVRPNPQQTMQGGRPVPDLVAQLLRRGNAYGQQYGQQPRARSVVPIGRGPVRPAGPTALRPSAVPAMAQRRAGPVVGAVGGIRPVPTPGGAV